MNDTQQQNQQQPLNISEVRRLGGIAQRLQALLSNPVAVPGKDAEVQKLLSGLGDGLLTHALELLNAWVGFHTEYLPALGALDAIQQRLDAGRTARLGNAFRNSKPAAEQKAT